MVAQTSHASKSSPKKTHLEDLEESIAPIRETLLKHPIYKSMTSASHVQVFMSQHVFAVWDFMSILKSLQIHLTCTEVPWIPPAHPEAARLINEIVLGEESDKLEDGSVMSHFDLYLKAMKEIGSPCQAIQDFLKVIRGGGGVEAALSECGADDYLKDFILLNQRVTKQGVHQIAAFFLYGREDIIPDMFQRLLDGLESDLGRRLSFFRLYLERHIELDGDDHGPKARLLLESVCGDDPRKWEEAKEAAEAALRARVDFWGAIRKLTDQCGDGQVLARSQLL